MAFTLETKRKQRFDFMRCLYDKTEGSEVGLVYIEEVAEEIQLPELETEMLAIYLADEGLIRVRMQHIISITHTGIDEVETLLAQPDRSTTHFPPLQSVPFRPESASEIRRDQDRDRDLPPPPLKPVNKPADDLAAMELKHICDAIGLDPREITGEAAPAPFAAAGKHDFSDDVRKLIEHAEAASAQRPLFHPSAGEPREAATRPVSRSRARSLKPANMESVQAPVSRESEMADVLASLKLRLLKIRLAAEDMGEAEAEIATATAQLLSPRPKLPIITASLATLLSILEEKAGAAALTSDIEASLAKLRTFLQQPQV